MPVVFHHLVPVTLKNKKPLKTFINKLFITEEKCLKSMNVIFCSDEYLLDINQQHLQHNFYTDIITFDLSESNSSSITAELYISIDRVRDNAKTLKNDFSTELHRVIFHGALHLCGYKDKKNFDINIMRQKEEETLNQYFPN